MDKKSVKRIIQKKGKFYSETERHRIIQEMIKNQWTKQYAWELYTGEPEERGQLMRWMRKLGYVKEIKHKQFKPPTQTPIMAYQKRKEAEWSDEEFEMMQLKKRIAELERQLKEAEMKAIAWSTLVDIAEKEFNIPIKKKFSTKPSQK